MKHKRFFGKNFSETIKKIKDNYGDNFYLVSQGKIELNGVSKYEIVVGIEEGVEEEKVKREPINSAVAKYFSDISKKEDAEEIEHFPSLERPSPKKKEQLNISELQVESKRDKEKALLLEELDSLRDEIKKNNFGIREELLKIVSGMEFYKEPEIYNVIKRLMNYGFSYSFASNLAHKFKVGDEKTRIKNIIKEMGNDLEFNSSPLKKGIHALIGPPGVGKTTTIAKLAHLAIKKFGKSKVLLISTDSYRIGAFNQLKTYSNLLGVKAFQAKSIAEIENIFEKGGFDIAFVDTSGVSHNNHEVKNKIISFEGIKFKFNTHLAIPANYTSEIIKEVIKSFTTKSLKSAIITKIDESILIAPVIENILEKKIPISYITSGQAVPADIILAKKDFIIHSAFKNKNNIKTQELNISILGGK